MAVPKRRTSKAKQGHRRSHHNLGAGKSVQYCVRCNDPVMSHRICAKCGFYRGRDAVVIEDKNAE
ncbi:MAG: 50S ribosomal protein L32 [Fimbriiglobus sp.]